MQPQAEVNRVIKCLCKWFDAIESGEALNWFPEPNYPRAITQEQADQIVMEIDKLVGREANRLQKEAGPGFDRLPPEQRLALAQELDSLLNENEET